MGDPRYLWSSCLSSGEEEGGEGRRPFGLVNSGKYDEIPGFVVGGVPGYPQFQNKPEVLSQLKGEGLRRFLSL